MPPLRLMGTHWDAVSSKHFGSVNVEERAHNFFVITEKYIQKSVASFFQCVFLWGCFLTRSFFRSNWISIPEYLSDSVSKLLMVKTDSALKTMCVPSDVKYQCTTWNASIGNIDTKGLADSSQTNILNSLYWKTFNVTDCLTQNYCC